MAAAKSSKTPVKTESSRKENLVEVRGKIIKICSNGEILVSFLEKLPDFSCAFKLVQLDGLELYSGTDSLSRLSTTNSNWLLDEEFVILLNPTTFFKSKIVNLFRDFPHGRVNMNIQIRNRLWMMFQSEMKLGLEPKLCKFLSCDPAGNIWFQIYNSITDKILRYFQNNQYPTFPPETRETLMTDGLANTNTYLAPYYNDEGLYRIKIHCILSSNVMQVEYIDFNEFQDIQIKNIFNASKIDETFAHFPPLCLRGHLMDIASVDVGQMFQVQENEIIRVQLTTLEPKDVFGDDETPEVFVDIKNKWGRWIDFNSLLVDKGVAVPEVPITDCTNICGVVYNEEEDKSS